MDILTDKQLPFLTRNQMAWKDGAALSIRIVTSSNTARAVSIRGFTKEGPFSFNFSTDGLGYQETHSFNVADFPVLLSIIDVGGNFSQGQCFATISLLVNGDKAYDLCSGYIYADKGLSYPTSPSPEIQFQRGQATIVQGTDPAAGGEISDTVPANETWHLVGMRFQLVTDGNAANRRVHIVIRAATRPVFEFFSDVDHAASLTRNYSCANFGVIPDTLDDNDILVPMPANIVISDGMTIKSETTNIQATDNFGKPDYYVIRNMGV